MKTIYFILTAAICVATSLSHSREFTSTDGKTIEAEVVAVSADSAVFKMGIKQYTVPLDKLSKPDQDYLAEWRKKNLEDLVPKLDVQINTGKSNKSDRSDSFDNRLGSFQFSLVIENEENNYSLKGGSAVLAVIGEDCDADDRYSVMQISKFSVDLEIAGKFEWSGNPMTYEFDDRPPSYWGHQYHGYIFELKNANGKVIFRKVLPTKFEGGADKILAMEASSGFDGQYRSTGRASIYEK